MIALVASNLGGEAKPPSEVLIGTLISQ